MRPGRQARLAEVQALRRQLRRDLQSAYEATIVREREWVDRVLSPDIFDDVGDEMREWVQSWYYDVKKLPKYPPERERKLAGTLLGLPRKTPKDMFPAVDPVIPGVPREYACGRGGSASSWTQHSFSSPLSARKLGGSNLVTADFWCTSTEFKEAAEKLAKDKKKGKGAKGGKPKLSLQEKKELRAKRREAKKAEKQRKLADKQRGFQLEESAVMPALGIAEQEYRVVSQSGRAHRSTASPPRPGAPLTVASASTGLGAGPAPRGQPLRRALHRPDPRGRDPHQAVRGAAGHRRPDARRAGEAQGRRVEGEEQA